MTRRRGAVPQGTNPRPIQGPQSALTDFLAAHNISANQIRLDADQRRAAAAASRAADDGSADTSLEPSAEPEAPPPQLRHNETKAQQKKRKLEEEKAIAKIKASKQFQRRNRDLDSEDEDEAARAIYKQSMAPLPGQMENCAICDTRFTVTAYSRAGPNGGLLCPSCTKELGKEDGPAKKKRKTISKGNRRSIASRQLEGTYHTGSKSLVILCIETLAKNVESAEDFGDLPSEQVKRLAALISKKRLVVPAVQKLFLKPGADTIPVLDGANLGVDDWIRAFQIVPTVKHFSAMNAIQFKNDAMDYLTGCTVELETFSIHGANLIDDDRWNAYMTKKGHALRTLKVYHTDGHFGDEQLEQLAISCPSLEVLKVSHNQKITDAGIKHIAGLSKLQRLSLEFYTPKSSEPYVEVLSSVGKSLRKFALTNITSLDDSVLKAIHDNCTILSKLRLANNEVFTNEGFVHLFTSWSNPPLEHIDLHECRYVDAAKPRDNPDEIGLCSSGFEALMAHSGSRLRHLNIKSCRHITTEALEKVFSSTMRYNEMKEIDVSFVWGVNDFIVGSIFRSCPNLKTLKIFGNFGVREVKVPRNKILIGMPNAMGMQIEGDDDE